MQFQGLSHTVRWQLIRKPIDYWQSYDCAVSDRVQVHPLSRSAGCIVPCIIVHQISQLNPHVLIQSMRTSFAFID